MVKTIYKLKGFSVLSLTAILLSALILPRPAVADDVAPSEPGSLRGVRYSDTAGEILWTPATDNTMVIGYRITRDDEPMGVLDARSVFEPSLEPGRAYLYSVRAVDRAGNEGAPLIVQIPAINGAEQQGISSGQEEPVGEQGETESGGESGGPDEGMGTADGGLILYSAMGRVTLQEGDASGLSINLSVNRLKGERRPVTLSLVADSERDSRQMRHRFSTTTLSPNESGSVLTLHLDVGIAPLYFHERYFKIVADDGISRASADLIIDVTPTSAPDVYLLIGQSNMEGYSEIGSKERFAGGQDQRVDRIQQLNAQPNSRSIFTSEASFTDESLNVLPPLFVPAEDPLHEPRYIGVDGKGATFVGLGLTFAKEALRTSTATIYLVPSAWGATGFCANSNGNLAWNAAQTPEEFLGGTLLADRAMTRLNMTLRETGGVLRGILWHQGGADSNNPDCARTYADNLSKLVKRVRREARQDPRGSSARGNDAVIPLVVATQSKGDDSRGRFSIFNPYKQQVDAAHRTVNSYIPYSDFVNNDDLVPPRYSCGQVSCVHFGAAALREQGRRFYAALKRIWSATGAYHY